MSYRNEAERIAEAKRVAMLLESMDERMPGDLSSTNVTAAIAAVEQQLAAVKQLKADLAAAVDAKDSAFGDLRGLMKRVRSGAKAVFGDDSLEYERVGGKRASEIKRGVRREELAAV